MRPTMTQDSRPLAASRTPLPERPGTTALLPPVLVIGLILGGFLWGGATELPGAGPTAPVMR